TSVLSSMLGGGATGVLTSTVSRFLGIGEEPVRTLMGLLTPLIMGVLGREQRAAGLDASGLARMLIGQKNAGAAAMPTGLGQLLEANTRLHDGTVSREGRTYEAPVTAHSAAMQRVRDDTIRGGARWLYWMLPLLALAGLLWYLFASDRGTVGPVATSIATPEPTRELQTKSAFLGSAPDGWVSIGSAPDEYVNKAIYNRAGY